MLLYMVFAGPRRYQRAASARRVERPRSPYASWSLGDSMDSLGNPSRAKALTRRINVNLGGGAKKRKCVRKCADLCHAGESRGRRSGVSKGLRANGESLPLAKCAAHLRTLEGRKIGATAFSRRAHAARRRSEVRTSGFGLNFAPRGP